MRVLINVNEQLSATMMQKYFQASGLEAEVTAASNDMMLGIAQASKFELIAFYANEIDNNALISFFNAIGNARKIMFVKKYNVTLVNEELEKMLDECFAIPFDSGDLMIRLRRMFKDARQNNAEPMTPPHPEKIPATRELAIEPIKTDFSYTAESFLPQPDYTEKQTALPPAENMPASDETQQQPVSSAEPPTEKKKKAGEKKSTLRYLNKTELLEIILEQEKMLIELNLELINTKKELDNRQVVLGESGSIAEAALKLNGVFEAAQKSADQYLASVKTINACPEHDQPEDAGE